MSTTNLTISLPNATKADLDRQAAEEGYATVEALIEALLGGIARDRAERRLQTLLVEGLESGPAIEATPEYWSEKRRKWASHDAQGNKP